MRFIFVLIFVMALTSSCGEKVFTGDVDCNECYSDKPDGVDLEIQVTLNGEYPEVPIVVYRGKIEENQVEFVDTVFNNPYYLFVKPELKYSVKAKYEKEDKTLFVVDATEPKVLKVSAECDEACYVIENTSLDVRIKKNFLDF
jgi:hypothetical protein